MGEKPFDAIDGGETLWRKMMAAPRPPIGSSPLRITMRALQIFKRMRRLERACECEPGVDYVTHRRCDACERRWSLHPELVDELQLRPWEWPAFEDPEAPVHPTCQPDPAGRDRFRQLEAAVRAERKAKRAQAAIEEASRRGDEGR